MKLPLTLRAMLPRDNCYWALLNGSGATSLRGRKRHVALLYELERSLPVSIESVSASFVVCGESIVACAAPSTTIEYFRHTHDSLTPDALPDELAAYTLDVASFDFFGQHTKSKRHERFERVRRLCIASLAIAASGLVTIGLAFRSHRLNAESDKYQAEIDAAYGHIFDLSVPTLQPAGVRLVAALREAELAAAGAASSTSTESNALPVLLHVLSKWPESVGLRLDRLSVGSSEASLDVSLNSGLDASSILESLSAPQGWATRSPRIQQRRDGQTLQINFHPVPSQESR